MHRNKVNPSKINPTHCDIIIAAIWLASRIFFFHRHLSLRCTPKKEAVRISPNFLPLIFAWKKVTTHPGGLCSGCSLVHKATNSPGWKVSGGKYIIFSFSLSIVDSLELFVLIFKIIDYFVNIIQYLEGKIGKNSKQAYPIQFLNGDLL